MTIIYLALRNLFLRRKRYALMAIAILLGFSLITILSGLAFGALETIRTKAARYFSGHIALVSFTGRDFGISNADEIIEKLKEARFPLRAITKRSVYWGREARIFFAGNSIIQRRAIGIDFEAEREIFKNLSFVEGSYDSMLGESGNGGILISRTAAEIIGARVGDDVIFYITIGQQINTATKIIRGIFDETSIFGYASYMRIEDLNKLINNPGFVTDIALYVNAGVNTERLAERIRLTLEKSFPVFPRIYNESGFRDARNSGAEVETIAVVPIDAQLAEIRNILNAFLAGIYFFLVVFVIIVMIGILNTYRVLVYERTREIGTMRAMGMQKKQVKFLFLTEAAALAIIASLGGFVLGVITLSIIVSLVDLSAFSAAGLFTESGRLNFFIDPKVVFFNTIFMLFAVVLAAWGPAAKASNLPPVQALGKGT
ncbi:MAG: FtsX-like permease family protein [Spirochaetes bacterium]|nr:FtsX-like permease family protein [Spirochaetota bacterium]